MKQLAFPTFLLVSLLVSSIFLQPTVAGPPTTASPPTKPVQPTKPAPPTEPVPMKGFCDSKCGVRCADAGAYHRCIKYCGICCQQCNCVPSGTYGNKSECPCYKNKLNSKGMSKCP